VKLRGTRRFTDWAEDSATASGSAGDQPDATRMLLLLDLAEACSADDAMGCGVYTRGPGRGCGWRVGGDGLFDAVCGRSCVLLKGHSF
jgi:hypothetical protein